MINDVCFYELFLFVRFQYKHEWSIGRIKKEKYIDPTQHNVLTGPMVHKHHNKFTVVTITWKRILIFQMIRLTNVNISIKGVGTFYQTKANYEATKCDNIYV